MSELLDRIRQEIAGYDSLIAEEVDGAIHITGKLDIGLGDDDQFDVQIILDDSYPYSMPRTYETGGRVPRVLDRHYYTGDDAGCCLCMSHLLRKRFPVDAPISTYIDQLVIPYFQNQVHYEITGKYVSEYSHGFAGIYEYYCELFDTTDPQVIAQLVSAVLARNLGGARPCPCGGKRKQRKCHLKSMKELKRYSHDGQLRLDVENFKKVLERQQDIETANADDKRISA